MPKTSQNNMPTKAQRAAQSAADKAKARFQAGSTSQPKAKKDQQVQLAPVAVGTRIVSSSPKVTRGARSMRIAHRELVVASIAGSTTFTVQNFLKLNPGLSSVFPWLAPQASQWEQYRCHKLIAQYVPIAPTSTAGDIIVSPNYDASDPQPTTEAQAGNNQDSVTDACWKRVDVRLDPVAMMGLGPRRFVRQSAVAGDVKTFDVGTLAICTNNEAGTSAVGKLYIEYDFEFFIPQNDPSGATAPTQVSEFTYAASQTFTTTVAANLNANTVGFDPLGIGLPSSGTYTPPAGVYDVEWLFSATDSSAETFTVAAVVQKNGSALSPAIQQKAVVTAPAGGFVPIAVRAIIACNGTDTVSCSVTMTGATGTLLAAAGANTCIWRLA